MKDVNDAMEKGLIVFSEKEIHGARKNKFWFNKYLFDNSHYSNLDFNSTEMFSNLVSHFEKNCVDEDTQKKIVISSPMVFSCEDFDKQLEFVYKDSNLEGIIIIDQDDVKHPYKIKIV